MNKFKPGDTVKVTKFGYNAKTFFDPKIHDKVRGVYQFDNWSDISFTVSNLPVRFWEGFEEVEGCNCYPLALNNKEIGYVYEEALVKI